MEKIVFVEEIDREPKNISYALQIAKKKGAKLSALFLIPVVVETVDWIEVQEKQIKEKEDKVASLAMNIEEDCKKQGISFEWKVVQYRPRAFIKAIEEFSPAELIIVGDMDLKPLAEEGIKHLEDISARFNCPVLSIKTLLPREKASKGKVFTRMAFFGALSALSYFVFFPQIDKLNHVIYMKGTLLGALAVLLTVPLHAYIYGSFTECIPKLLGLEKSAGGH
jgi:hypothetical protein